jgi:fumarate hydratase subunit alpha
MLISVYYLSMDQQNLVLELARSIEKAETELPADVISFLKNAKAGEKNETTLSQLNAILKNIDFAKSNKLPICQDTGTMTFYVDLGFDFPFAKELYSAMLEATKKVTASLPLRSNTTDPFTGKNTETNVGKNVPNINWNMVDGSDAIIHILPKGGGSENMSGLGMLKPGEGIKGIKKFVVEHVIKSGAYPCPPTILGIGIGGGSELSLILAKRSLLRELGERNPEPEAARLELDLLELLNKTDIGTMGYGGNVSVLDVHVEYASRHPASLPVGIVTQCWADRRATVKVDKIGNIDSNYHPARR